SVVTARSSGLAASATSTGLATASAVSDLAASSAATVSFGASAEDAAGVLSAFAASGLVLSAAVSGFVVSALVSVLVSSALAGSRAAGEASVITALLDRVASAVRVGASSVAFVLSLWPTLERSSRLASIGLISGGPLSALAATGSTSAIAGIG